MLQILKLQNLKIAFSIPLNFNYSQGQCLHKRPVPMQLFANRRNFHWRNFSFKKSSLNLLFLALTLVLERLARSDPDFCFYFCQPMSHNCWNYREVLLGSTGSSVEYILIHPRTHTHTNLHRKTTRRLSYTHSNLWPTFHSYFCCCSASAAVAAHCIHCALWYPCSSASSTLTQWTVSLFIFCFIVGSAPSWVPPPPCPPSAAACQSPPAAWSMTSVLTQIVIDLSVTLHSASLWFSICLGRPLVPPCCSALLCSMLVRPGHNSQHPLLEWYSPSSAELTTMSILWMICFFASSSATLHTCLTGTLLLLLHSPLATLYGLLRRVRFVGDARCVCVRLSGTINRHRQSWCSFSALMSSNEDIHLEDIFLSIVSS